MEVFLFFLFSAGVVWLIAALVRLGDRVSDLESEITALKREQRERRQAAPQPKAAEAPAPAPEGPAEPETATDKPVPVSRESSPPPLPEKAAAEPPPLPSRPASPEKPKVTVAIRTVEGPRDAAAAAVGGESANAFPWRPLLERLYLWPPSGENAEAAIFGWWLTRIGLVIGIIAAVFFGIRIAEDVQPPVRIAALAAIATGVTLLGMWLERRVTAFGRLVSAGGLSLYYFTAFAAYALEPTKVIPDEAPALALAMQGLALILILAWSLWKADRHVATMALALGFVSCGFSHRHDLDNFVITGLLILAAGGSALLWPRRWLPPFAVAAAGAWSGFLLLAAGDWPAAGHAPAFPIALGSIVLLAALLELTNFLAAEKSAPASGPFESRALRWIAVFNTSAAVLAGWVATRFAFRDHLEDFYLVFAVLIFAFAALRFWKKHPVALVETFFLKAAALLALYFVARFDGPVRWLSLTLQAGALLWTWRRSRLIWIEIGFAVVFTAAAVWMLRDLPDPVVTVGEWRPVRDVIGVLSLLGLSAWLALHARWDGRAPLRTEAESGALSIHPVALLRGLGAALIALGAIQLAVSPNRHLVDATNGRLVFLTLLALALAAPAVFTKRFPPILAGLFALVPVYRVVFLDQNFNTNGDLALEFWLAALGFGLAEGVRRFWPRAWTGSSVVGTLFAGLGFLAAINLLWNARARFDLSGHWPVWIAAAVGSLLAIQQSLAPRKARGADWDGDIALALLCLLALWIGGAIVWLAFTGNAFLLPVHLAIAAAILFAAAFATRDAVPAIAGGIPLAAGLFEYTVKYSSGATGPLRELILCAAALTVVSLATALVLWRKTDATTRPWLRLFDAALHGVWIFAVHWIFRGNAAMPTVFMADAALAVGIAIVSAAAPIRTLPWMSGLPLGLALAHGFSAALDHDWEDGSLPWWLASAAVFAWLCLSARRAAADRDTLKSHGVQTVHIVSGLLAAVTLCVTGFHAAPNPWHLGVLAAFAVALTLLWRRLGISWLGAWSALPLGLAYFGGLLRVVEAIDSGSGTAWRLSISLTAILVIANGLFLVHRGRSPLGLAWLHGFAALGLAFPAIAAPHFGHTQLTTVFWGVAAIALFLTGLAARLRPYRIVGLVGLACCLVRIFTVDIVDPLYRIYAFFVVAVVLLAMGYLYNRFRHLIDRPEAPDLAENPEKTA
ncbi:MAG: hypothetical protein H7A52_15845 [Akkermansiaceae bacterium]|nr:hypothetical protein [Akkermansiaceae bacterium]